MDSDGILPSGGTTLTAQVSFVITNISGVVVLSCEERDASTTVAEVARILEHDLGVPCVARLFHGGGILHEMTTLRELNDVGSDALELVVIFEDIVLSESERQTCLQQLGKAYNSLDSVVPVFARFTEAQRADKDVVQFVVGLDPVAMRHADTRLRADSDIMQLLLKRNHYDVAMELFTEALEMPVAYFGKDFRLKVFRGRSECARQLRIWDTCCRDATAVLEVEPEDVCALQQRAASYEAMGQIDAAAEDAAKLRLIMTRAGTLVTIVGLRAQPTLNGKIGRVLGNNIASGRINVQLLDDIMQDGQRLQPPQPVASVPGSSRDENAIVAVKPANLALAACCGHAA